MSIQLILLTLFIPTTVLASTKPIFVDERIPVDIPTRENKGLPIIMDRFIEYKPLIRSNASKSPFEWEQFINENGQLSMKAQHHKIHPCEISAGKYHIRLAGSKISYVSLKGRRLKLRLTQHDKWTVHAKEQVNGVSPVTLESASYDGRVVLRHKYVGSIKQRYVNNHHFDKPWEYFTAIGQLNIEELVPWCADDDQDRVYLQVLDSNIWVQKDAKGDRIALTKTYHPDTAFNFVETS